MSYCTAHKVQEFITCKEIETARERWPNLKSLKKWGGVADFGGLGCRGCWGVINEGDEAVECGVGAFHLDCFDAITKGT